MPKGSCRVSGGDASKWFPPAASPEEDHDLEALGFDERQRRFVYRLRERISGWPEDPEISRVELPDTEGAILAWLDLDDTQNPRILATYGVAFDGSSIKGDKVISENLELEHTSNRLTAAGDPEVLAGLAAEWFFNLLRRPVLRQEWTSGGGTPPHERWIFADTGEVITEEFPRPPGHRLRRLLSQDLPAPDRTVLVRGELQT